MSDSTTPCTCSHLLVTGVGEKPACWILAHNEITVNFVDGTTKNYLSAIFDCDTEVEPDEVKWVAVNDDQRLNDVSAAALQGLLAELERTPQFERTISLSDHDVVLIEVSRRRLECEDRLPLRALPSD